IRALHSFPTRRSSDLTFKDSKVFYSLYEEDFGEKDSVGAQYGAMAAQEDVSAEDVALFNNGSYLDVYKGALAYTDVVVSTGDAIHPELASFIEDKQIRVFTPESDTDYEAYAELYEEFASEEVEA